MAETTTTLGREAMETGKLSDTASYNDTPSGSKYVNQEEEREGNKKKEGEGDIHPDGESGGAACRARLRRPWRVYADTTLALAVFLGSGFNFSIMCQTLLDLERITSSDTAQVSEIFLWRGIGQILGCIFLGFIFDFISHNFLMGISMVLLGVLQALMPFQQHIRWLSLLFGVQSVGVGFITVGTMYVLVKRWKERVGPFLQAQYLMYVVAGLLSPLIIRAFITQETLSFKEQPSNYSSNISFQAELLNNVSTTIPILNKGDALPESNPNPDSSAKYDHNIFVDDLLMNSSYTYKNDTSFISDNSTVLFTTKVDIVPVYLLCAGYIMLIACLCLIMTFFSGPFIIKKIKNKRSTDKVEGAIVQTECKTGKALKKRCCMPSIDKTNLLKVFLFTLMLTFEACMDTSFTGLIITFLVKELEWKQDDALLVPTALFFTSGVTRLIAIFVSRFISDLFIIVFDCVIATCGFIIMSTAIHLHSGVTWACVIAAGVSCSTILPSTLAYASNHVKVTGLVTSVFLSPLGTGLIFGPRMVGYFFQKHGPMWFPYMLCIYAVALDVIFVFALIAAKLFPKEYQHVMTDEEKYPEESEL